MCLSPFFFATGDAMRAVLFDMDGVLLHGFHTRPEVRVRWDQQLRQDMGIDPDDLEKRFFLERFERDVLSGKRSLQDVLAEVLPEIGYKGDVRDFVRYWLERDAKVNTDLLDIVKRLKASGQVKLYIATNNEATRADYLWNQTGFKYWFDDIFYASGFGEMKPNAAFFMACEKRMDYSSDLPPLFFDDAPHYVDGARSFGWEAVIYNDLSDCANHPYVKALIK